MVTDWDGTTTAIAHGLASDVGALQSDLTSGDPYDVAHAVTGIFLFVGTIGAAKKLPTGGPKEIPFRQSTEHIFRPAPGHLPVDTQANRALLQGAIREEYFVAEKTIRGQVVRTYQQLLPDGTQVWVEVRNGVEITNGGLNSVPKP